MSNSEDKYLQIYKGNHYSKPKEKQYNRVVAFDLDETLGSFVDLEILWRGILQFCTFSNKETENGENNDITIIFHGLLDLYPECLRYGIIPILEYLLLRKKEKTCNGLYIYTNNQCPKNWTDMISDYLNKRVNLNGETPLFDKVIYAFKLNNKRVDVSRTTHEKTPSDFIKCTLLPKNTEICFIDNSFYSQMKSSRIYYIKPRAYIHSLSTNDIIKRFSDSDFGKKICSTQNKMNIFCGFLWNEFYRQNAIQMGNNSNLKVEMDILIAQKIMYHIKEFFYFTNRRERTRKYKTPVTRLTRKKSGNSN